jgi:hypothetical protein
MRVAALALPHTAEIEPQHCHAPQPHAPSNPMHHLIVHRTSKKRMRMANQRGTSRRLLLRLFQDGL